jgi:sterol desaturase/sphingolipid hydroxylase (fatty acid hydroxylase superfamily)
MWPLGVVVVATLALTLLELRFPARGEPTQRGLNLAVWAATLVPTIFVTPLIALGFSHLGRSLGLPSLDIAAWPLLLSAATYLLCADLGEYLFHRAQHAVPALWRLHALHHSDPNVNATTTGRHFWCDPLIKAVTIWPIVALALRPSAADIAIYGLASTLNAFNHSNLAVDFGRWSWVLNSPAYHRVHHSRRPEDHGSNFAAMLPIFDVMAGSYRRPTRPPETGLDQIPRTLVQIARWPATPPPA